MTNGSSVVDEIQAATYALRGVWDEDVLDELDHALQAAEQARLARPGDDEFVVAALLHDIAHSPLVGPAGLGEPHERLARRWLTARLGARVGWLAGAHVAAKRALAADPGYAATLSPVSTVSLRRQGGAGVGAGWTRHPWWPDALLLRRCDDAAKVPGAPTPPWPALRAALTRVAGSGR